MNQDTTLQQEASVREARLRRRQLFRVFDTPDGREALFSEYHRLQEMIRDMQRMRGGDPQ